MKNDDAFREYYSEYYEDEELPHKKRKKRLGVRIYRFFSTFFGIVILFMFLYVFFHIQSVKVVGNNYLADEVIRKTVLSDSYSVNTLYVWGKYLIGKGDTLKNVDSLKVTIAKPWELKVTVKEKEIAGYIESKGEYFYFDQEGMVVYKARKLLEDITKVEGISPNNLSLYDTLDADNKEIFTQVLKATEGIKKYGIVTEKVVYRKDSIYLNHGNQYISLGKQVSEEQLSQIPPILEKLGAQEGTLHLENYAEGSDTITFKRGEFPWEL